MKSISVKLFRGKEGLREIEEEWGNIAAKRNEKHIFHLYQWHKSYIDSLEGKDNNVYYFLFYNNEIPFAILPIEKSIRRVFGIKFNILQIPPFFEFSDSDASDLIIDKEFINRDIVHLIVQALKKHIPSKWNFIILQNVYENSSINQFINNTSYPNIIKRKQSEHYYFDEKSYSHIFDKFSKNQRKSIKRVRKKLFDMGNVEFLTFNNESDIHWAFEKILELEKSGWKGKRGSPVSANAKYMKFYKNLINNFLPIHGVEVYLLSAQKKIIAGSLNLKSDDYVYGQKIAYDQNYGKFAPGISIADEILRKYSNDNSIKAIHVYDAKWMQKWIPSSFDVYNITIFRDSLIGRLGLFLLKNNSVIGLFNKINRIIKK